MYVTSYVILLRYRWTQGFLQVFAFSGGGGGTFGGEHSVEDHYLHKNWIIFFFFGGGGRLPPKQASREPWYGISVVQSFQTFGGI